MTICPGPPEWDEMTPLARRVTWVFIALFLLAVAALSVHRQVGTEITELVAFLAAVICLMLILVALVGLFPKAVLIAVFDVFVGLAHALGLVGRRMRNRTKEGGS
jgi:hypothetical protein